MLDLEEDVPTPKWVVLVVGSEARHRHAPEGMHSLPVYGRNFATFALFKSGALKPKSMSVLVS